MPNSLFGNLLAAVANRRRALREDAIRAMLERQGGKYPHNKDGVPEPSEGFMVIDVQDPKNDGLEVKTYRLYKLVDETTVTVSFDLKEEIENGIKKKGYNELHTRAEANNGDSPL